MHMHVCEEYAEGLGSKIKTAQLECAKAVCVCVCMYACMYMHMHVCVGHQVQKQYVCVYVCMYVYVYACVCRASILGQRS